MSKRRMPRGCVSSDAIHNRITIMTCCIVLLNFTDKGSSHIKKSTSRAYAFADLAAKSGVKVEGQFWTTGQYDGAQEGADCAPCRRWCRKGGR